MLKKQLDQVIIYPLLYIRLPKKRVERFYSPMIWLWMRIPLYHITHYVSKLSRVAGAIDFRDAKQFYGLSDFKNYHQTQVTNAVNIAFTMTLISKLLLKKYESKLNCEGMGIIDLKSVFRVTKYAEIFFKSNSNQADEFLNSPQFLSLARLEAIHI